MPSLPSLKQAWTLTVRGEAGIADILYTTRTNAFGISKEFSRGKLFYVLRRFTARSDCPKVSDNAIHFWLVLKTLMQQQS